MITRPGHARSICIEALPTEVLVQALSDLDPRDAGRCLCVCAAWKSLSEDVAVSRASRIGMQLLPPAERVARHSRPKDRTFFGPTCSALHALDTLETRVNCRVDLSASRFSDLQYHVLYLNPAGELRTHTAWKEEALRNHVTVLDGQAVCGHWMTIDGSDWLNLGPGEVPRAFELRGEQHLGLDKLLRKKWVVECAEEPPSQQPAIDVAEVPVAADVAAAAVEAAVVAAAAVEAAVAAAVAVVAVV